MLVGKPGGANDGNGHLATQEQHGPGRVTAAIPPEVSPPARTSSLNFRKPGIGNEFASNESYQMVNIYWRF
jgi:hypothetical protein